MDQIQESTKQYEQLVAARNSITQGQIESARQELLQILGASSQTLEERALLYAIDKKLRTLSLEIQWGSQDLGILRKKVDKVPHLDDTLRSQRLGEYMSYTDRLGFVLSPANRYAKINEDHLKNEKNAPWYKGKKKNKGAVEDHVKQDFFNHHFVLDPDKITDDMRLHLLDGKSIDSFTHDPQLQSLKQKFAKPYFLQYQVPGRTPEDKEQKKATSRIMFFRDSPAIAVFRSADTHPIVADPTKHEKRKIQKDMDMYVTNSSYDIISQQYQSIQHITKDKEFIASLLQELQNLVQDKAFGPDQKLQISQAIDAISGQINPEVLMARLYNLSKIEDFANKTVQQNLLLGALNKLGRRSKKLWLYLYYMIPQLQGLETIHAKNIENIETLHRNILMSASANNPSPRSLPADKWRQMQQFNKHDILAKVERALRQHDIEQKDHLMGMFYTMHDQIGTLLHVTDQEEKNKMAKIIVYSHRLIMAAEQLKQDIELGKVQRPNIYVHTHFQEIWADIHGAWFSTQDMDKFFTPYFKIMKKVGSYTDNRKEELAIKELSKFKEMIEPTLQK